MRVNPAVLLRGTALVHDMVVGASAFLLSLALRLTKDGVVANLTDYLVASLLFGLLVGVVGFATGLNRGIWRYASLPDLFAIVKTATITIMVFVFVHFLVIRLEAIPRSTPIITWALLVIMLAAPRAIYRAYRNGRDTRRQRVESRAPPRPVLLVGASDNADLFMKTIDEGSGPAFKVLAVVDERGRRIGRYMRGVPILGPLDRLGAIAERFAGQGRRPEAVVLTRSREDFEQHARIETLIELAAEQGLEVLRLPNLLDMRDLSAPMDVRPIRLEDLLQRLPVTLQPESLSAFVAGRRILITGAGGSIGSELARQIAAERPAELVVLDASEFLLYGIESELRRLAPQTAVTARLGNVREAEAIGRIVADIAPDIIFHAAALKHVPIVEAQPLEGIHTNAIGTRNVAEAAIRAGVGAMVLVSTDKAVNPANVMGATKRMAEMFCQAQDLAPGSGTRFVTVRFGNVLGSAGSVVPLFEKQLETGGPLTVTHPDIERYFMTIPEACLLVLQAAIHGLAHPDRRGRIFVLDMGTPVKIVDLARNVIRLSGLRPDIDVRIVFTGLRPGEKLFEELFDQRETLGQTDVAGLLVASPRAIERALVARIFDEMQRLVDAGDAVAALRLLKSTVPEFTPGEETRRALDAPPPGGLPLKPAPAAEGLDG